MKSNKHQQQITNKIIICLAETTKSSMYHAVHVTKSEVNKILEVFLPLTLLFIPFIHYVKYFIFDEKGAFYI